jgi:hypothetical protein
MLRVSLLAALAALAALACGPRPPQPAPTGTSHVAPLAPADAVVTAPLDQDLPRLAARSLAMYQDVAKLFAAVGEDCAAATAKLGAFEATYHDVVSANAKVLHDGRAKELKVALEPHAEPIDFAAKSIAQSATMAKCSADVGFEKAFDALFEVPP